MKFVKYSEEYFNEISKIMEETWNFHTAFPDVRNRTVIYEFFLREVLNISNYDSVVVDDNGGVYGCLFGLINKKKTIKSKMFYFFKSAQLFFKGLYFIFTNEFGNKKYVLKSLMEIKKVIDRFQRDKGKFDSSIELLILSSKARGKGLGKRLVGDYVEYCKKSDIHSIYLYTDRGCSFEFYDKYGFIRKELIHSPFLPKPEFEYNGFVYVYYIE